MLFWATFIGRKLYDPKQTFMTRKKVSPLAWVPTAYFAMGLPFIMLNLVAPIMFNDFGISDAQVAFWTSLLILPWSL